MSEYVDLYESEYDMLLRTAERLGREATAANLAEQNNMSIDKMKKALDELESVCLVTKENDHYRLLSYHEALKRLADYASFSFTTHHPAYFEARKPYMITEIMRIHRQENERQGQAR